MALRILISGGAGFVGSHLGLAFRQKYPQASIVAMDNLRRSGAEGNLARLKESHIEFVHGDVRMAADLAALPGNFDLFVEASAEPSVSSGLNGNPSYVIDTNLGGTVNCLEFARARCEVFVFLSTSRVYSIPDLQKLPLVETDTRFQPDSNKNFPGLVGGGITEAFSRDSYRSFYGTSKLASELLIEEYSALYGLKSVINRCGVICGPGQFGKVDQGVFSLWVASHYYGTPLKYMGFGGSGKQVRDLLHPQDLFELIGEQWKAIKKISGQVFNVGGGLENSVSLVEWTKICREVTGRSSALSRSKDSNAVDIPYYVTQCQKVESALSWKPKIGSKQIATEIAAWVKQNEKQLRMVFAA